MSPGSHRWTRMSGKSRAAVAVAAAGAIGAVTVGVSNASTADPHDQAAAKASQAPRTAAHQPHHRYATGAVPSHDTWRKAVLDKPLQPRLAAIAPGTPVGAARTTKKATLPTAVDLTRYTARPGNQGQVGSCAAWAVDYTAYSVLEHEQKISGGPQAPMYTYSQITKGQNIGTSLGAHLGIAKQQGIDSKSHYWQGDFDYTTQPTAGEQRNAAKWKLTGYTPLHTGSQIKADVKAALAKGEPVVIAIPVHNSFFDITPQQSKSYSYYPAAGDPEVGGHALTIVGYTSKGVKIENSWGSGWADHGFVNLSWKFLADQAWEANAVGKLVKR
ncbi:C1 family peptidase [Streptomyces gilvosporeus]|uniref:Peptidase C1A papain C-terminal domain-containing protein n=1 Tax=Streptomyces gilvosporeus TaxID=553510 RepID=A0A1V0U0D4_9ACTN|nr:C1 family peptidase [Streptomyces gilvosporeus]ARF58498.1 hypothetical protein B1H19_33765 [Streptomyces gilvosporeus]